MKKVGWLLLMFMFCGTAVLAQDAAPAPEASAVEAVAEGLQNNLNIVWTCIAAFMVFFMQAGFAMVESGFTRAKNAINIIMKNLMDFSVGSVAFFLVGFGLMFGESKGFIGLSHFGLSGITGTEGGSEWGFTFFIFQLVFAATAATKSSAYIPATATSIRGHFERNLQLDVTSI